jgi:transposase-like protein
MRAWKLRWNSGDLRLRAVFRIITAPRGAKAAVVSQLGAELGVGERTLYRWKRRFERGGYTALFRKTRSEAGRPRLYSAHQLQALIEAAPRIRRGLMFREFLALGLPGSYGSFRHWIWKARRHGAAAMEAAIA